MDKRKRAEEEVASLLTEYLWKCVNEAREMNCRIVWLRIGVWTVSLIVSSIQYVRSETKTNSRGGVILGNFRYMGGAI